MQKNPQNPPTPFLPPGGCADLILPKVQAQNCGSQQDLKRKKKVLLLIELGLTFYPWSPYLRSPFFLSYPPSLTPVVQTRKLRFRETLSKETKNTQLVRAGVKAGAQICF